MGDKDYLLEMLTTEKNISVNLVYALNEASNKNIYDLYFKMLKLKIMTSRDLDSYLDVSEGIDNLLKKIIKAQIVIV